MKKLKKLDEKIDHAKLLEQNGKYYYIDVKELAERTILEGKVDAEGEDMLHFQKYETYKALIEVLLTPVDPLPNDDVLSAYKKTPPPFDFKIAFNTLIIDKILKNYE